MSTLDIIFAAAGAGGAATYWIATNDGYPLGYNSDIIFSNGFLVDSSGNSYNVFVNNKITYIIKYSKNGLILWQRSIYPTTLALDSTLGCVFYNSNVVVCTTGRNGSTGYSECAVSAYDSNGTIQYRSSFGKATTQMYSRDLSVDSSTNTLFVVAPRYIFNTSGSSLSSLVYWSGGYSLDYTRTYSIGSDLYTASYFYLAKYGAWQKDFVYTIREMASDSSGFLYLVGGLGTGAVLTKLNSSGTVQWQVKLANTTATDDAFNGIFINSANDIFVCGQTLNSSGNLDILIAKYNTSGTLQWQRTLSTTGADTGLRIKQGQSGVLMVYGTTNVTGTTRNLLMRVPDDGSLQGTYGSFTYATSTLTASTSSVTPAAATTPSYTTQTGTIASGSYTLGTPTYTSSLTTIQ